MKRLGPLDVPRVGIGCNNFGWGLEQDAARAVVDAALDAGVGFFDTADVYGGPGVSERYLGAALRGRRDAALIATKFGQDMGDGAQARGSRAYMRAAVDASLQRLETDRIDLLYYHIPDGVTPFPETLRAMDELVREGKVRALGCSNLSAAQLEEVGAIVQAEQLAPVVALQSEYSLLERGAERTLLPLAQALGVALVPYFPLAGGLLSGKYRPGQPPPAGARLASRPDMRSEDVLGIVGRLEAFAAERGHTLLELAISALASRPGVGPVIAGATRPAQVHANAAAAAWELTAEDRAALEAVAPAPADPASGDTVKLSAGLSPNQAIAR